ncbi:GAF domain-containing protein [Streptomyces sp. NPDC001415]
MRDLVEALIRGPREELGAGWAGEAAARLGWDGMAVSLAFDGPELVWFSDEVSARLEDAQFTVGQGPSLEAARDGAVCLVGDLGLVPGPRWVGFLSAAADLPVAAVFSFPLRLGALKIGALTGYRRRPGRIDEESVENALVLSDAVAEFLLRTLLPPAGEEADGPGGAGTVDLHRAEVHQATGKLAAQLSITLAAAMARLRAEAFASGRDITDVARAVLDGELRLQAHPHPADPGRGNTGHDEPC